MSIEGQVAKILDESALIINRGAREGVRAGMRFAVFVEVEDVPDPATGKSLGKWEMVKAEVVAAHVQESMAVCAAAPPAAAPQSDTYTLSASMVEASLAGGGRTRLNVDRGQVSGRPAAGPVRVGDRVRSLD